MKAKELIHEVASKYSEWLEHAGDRAPALLCEILAQMLIKERDNANYYKMVLELKNDCKATNS